MYWYRVRSVTGKAALRQHDNRMSKQFVNNVASVAILATLATHWHEVHLPPLEGEVVERQRNRRGLFVN